MGVAVKPGQLLELLLYVLDQLASVLVFWVGELIQLVVMLVKSTVIVHLLKGKQTHSI